MESGIRIWKRKWKWKRTRDMETNINHDRKLRNFTLHNYLVQSKENLF